MRLTTILFKDSMELKIESVIDTTETTRLLVGDNWTSPKLLSDLVHLRTFSMEGDPSTFPFDHYSFLDIPSSQFKNL